MTPTLWIVLVVVVLGLGAYVWVQQSATPSKPTRPATGGSDDLASLGLSEVRPATEPRVENASPPETSSRPPAPSSSPDPPPRQPEPALISTVSKARAKPSEPDDAFMRQDSPLWTDNADAIQPLLRSLAVSLGGGVAVLRHDDDAYAIDALIGVPGVRTPKPLKADAHPLHQVPQDTVLSILGPESRRALRYYADPEAAVGQAVARALAEPPARRVLLVADVPPDEEELSDDALALIARYGDLLAALSHLDDANSETGDAPPPDEEASDEETTSASSSDGEETEDATRASDDAPETSDEDASSHDDSVLPRAVVIQRQLDAAKEADHPLAFGLVTLAAADAVLRGDPERVAKAEADLRERLEGEAVCAVEPFGDLLLGVFLHASADDALAWAAALADTEPPLLVGLVPSVTEDPDAIRAAATEALEEAYHQGGGLSVASA
ncbi:MAG: hypothetical protein AAF170_10765 [Bacteroidota bacterium]